MSLPDSRFRLVLLAAALGLGTAGLGFWAGNRQSLREVEQLRNGMASLRAELQAAQGNTGEGAARRQLRQNGKSDGETAAASDGLTAPGLPAAEGTAAADGTGTGRPVDGEAMSSLLKSPMMQKIMASQTSAVMQMTYGRLMDELQLTPEERDHLQQLLVEKQTNLQNLGMQLMSPGITADARSSILTQLTEVWTGGEAKIREFLNNEADYTRYQAYSQQEPERKEMGMLDGALTGSDALDPAVSERLANLQNEARKTFPFTVDFYNQQNFGKPGVMTQAAVQTFLGEQTQFQDQMAGQAAELLTPAQLQAYKQNQAAVRQMSAMQLNSIVQMTGGGNQGRRPGE